MEVLINGVSYSQTETNEKIGIAITTHNRANVFQKALAEQQRFLPPGAILCVVDDGSDQPPKTQNNVRLIRNEKAQGIPAAKNAGIRILMEEGCTHLFLFDDDAYPLCADWYKPYIRSPEPHLCAIFTHWADGTPVGDCNIIGGDQEHIWYSHARGYMLYLHRSAIEKVGGMDTIYRTGYEEHLDLSDRIYTAGLTSWRYMDVRNSDKLIYSADQAHTVPTSQPKIDRSTLVTRNQKIRLTRKAENYAGFASYGRRRIVLASWLTTQTDAQRGKKQKPDTTILKPLADSVKGELALFHDEPLQGTLNATAIQVPTLPISPYVRRWQLMYQYLLKHPAEEVWLVDATDVVRLHEPQIEPGKLYVGWESNLTSCNWMKKNFTDARYTPLYTNPRQLLNCGVIGGDLETVKFFLRRMLDELTDTGDTLEMGAFNLVCYRDFLNRLVTGTQVTTLFKAEQKEGESWWKHK